jgi:hypothetical protein
MAHQNERKAKSEAARADVAAAKAKEEAIRADSEKQAAQTEEAKAKEALAAEADLSKKLRQQLQQATAKLWEAQSGKLPGFLRTSGRDLYRGV